MATKVGLVRGREVYLRYTEAFFKDDPNVKVIGLDEETGVLTIEVNDVARCAYLTKVLGGPKPHWDADLVVWVKAADSIKDKAWDVDNVWEIILGSNPFLDRVITVPGAMLTRVDVVVFKPIMLQVPVDDAFNPDNGIVTYTAEQLAREIFNNDDNTSAKFTTAAIKKDQPVKKVKKFGRR